MNRDEAMKHLKHMSTTRPGHDAAATKWAMEEIERLQLSQDCVLKTLKEEREKTK